MRFTFCTSLSGGLHKITISDVRASSALQIVAWLQYYLKDLLLASFLLRASRLPIPFKRGTGTLRCSGGKLLAWNLLRKIYAHKRRPVIWRENIP